MTNDQITAIRSSIECYSATKARQLLARKAAEAAELRYKRACSRKRKVGQERGADAAETKARVKSEDRAGIYFDYCLAANAMREMVAESVAEKMVDCTTPDEMTKAVREVLAPNVSEASMEAVDVLAQAVYYLCESYHTDYPDKHAACLSATRDVLSSAGVDSETTCSILWLYNVGTE
jgi:hypothetical protein